MKQPEEQDSLEELLVRAQPQLGRVLARYNIPPEDAEDLLRDVFLTLIFKRDRVADPQVWALRTLKHQCLAYWRRRRRVLYSALDAELKQSISRVEEDPDRRARFHRQLGEILDSLPSPCRGLLRERYGLESSEARSRLAGPPISDKAAERCVAALGKKLMEFGVLDGFDSPS